MDALASLSFAFPLCTSGAATRHPALSQFLQMRSGALSLWGRNFGAQSVQTVQLHMLHVCEEEKMFVPNRPAIEHRQMLHLGLLGMGGGRYLTVMMRTGRFLKCNVSGKKRERDKRVRAYAISSSDTGLRPQAQMRHSSSSGTSGSICIGYMMSPDLRPDDCNEHGRTIHIILGSSEIDQRHSALSGFWIKWK